MTDQNIPLHPQYPTAGTVHHCTHACIGGMHDACPRTDVDVITCNCVCHGRPTPHPASTSDARKRKAEKVNPIDPLDLAPSRRGKAEQAAGEQALAALIKAHDFSRMECADHGGKCCPTEGGCHDVEEHQYDHLARIVAAREQAPREEIATVKSIQELATATSTSLGEIAAALGIVRRAQTAETDLKAALARVEALGASIGPYRLAQSDLKREGVSFSVSGLILSALKDRVHGAYLAALAQPATDEGVCVRCDATGALDAHGVCDDCRSSTPDEASTPRCTAHTPPSDWEARCTCAAHHTPPEEAGR